MFHNGPYHGGVGNGLDFGSPVVDVSSQETLARTRFAFLAVIAVCLDHARLSVIEAPRCV